MLALSETLGHPWPVLLALSETLSEAEAREERIFLALRTAQGIAEGLVDPAQAAPLLADGRLVRTGSGRLRIPEDHWFVSDDIICRLIPASACTA